MESPVSLTNHEMSLRNRNVYVFVVPSVHQLLLGGLALCLPSAWWEKPFLPWAQKIRLRNHRKIRLKFPGKIWSWEEHWLLEQSGRRCWGSSDDSYPIKTIVSEFLDGDSCGFWLSCSGLLLPKSSLNENMIQLWQTFLYSYPFKVSRDFVLMSYVRQEVIILYFSFIFSDISFYYFRSLRNMGCQLKRLQNFIRRAKKGKLVT